MEWNSLAISLHWLEYNNEVYKHVIGLAEVHQTDAAMLTDSLKDTLICCGMQLCLCRGQAYDGVSNMSEYVGGVATRIQKEEPRALYAHCVAHSLNLCLQECDLLSLATELTFLIRASSKRLVQFRQLKDQVSPGSPVLKPLCPTTWTVRSVQLMQFSQTTQF